MCNSRVVLVVESSTKIRQLCSDVDVVHVITGLSTTIFEVYFKLHIAVHCRLRVQEHSEEKEQVAN